MFCISFFLFFSVVSFTVSFFFILFTCFFIFLFSDAKGSYCKNDDFPLCGQRRGEKRGLGMAHLEVTPAFMFFPFFFFSWCPNTEVSSVVGACIHSVCVSTCCEVLHTQCLATSHYLAPKRHRAQTWRRGTVHTTPSDTTPPEPAMTNAPSCHCLLQNPHSETISSISCWAREKNPQKDDPVLVSRISSNHLQLL